jgi:hypothetical protein
MHKNLQLSVIAAVGAGVLLFSASTFASAAFASQSNSITITQKIEQQITSKNCVVCGNGNIHLPLHISVP